MTEDSTIKDENFNDYIKKFKDKFGMKNTDFDDYDTIKDIDDSLLISFKDIYDIIKEPGTGTGTGTETRKYLFEYLSLLLINNIYYANKYITLLTYSNVNILNNVINDKYEYYEFFLTILFIFLAFIIIIIIYWDYVYRSANKLSRCVKIRDIVNYNTSNDYPFIYCILIVHEDNIDNIIDKYVIKLEYNFNKLTTKINYGDPEYLNNVTLDIGNDALNFNAFKYCNLYDMDYLYANFLDDDNVNKYIDKEKISNVKYKYITTTPTFKVLNDEVSLELAKFVKQYGVYQDGTPLYPIYNILNAAEQNKHLYL